MAATEAKCHSTKPVLLKFSLAILLSCPATAATQAEPTTASQDAPVQQTMEKRLPPPPPGAKALPAPHRVWIDAKQGKVLVDGYVSLNEGLLEMFACPVGTKEHESVVAVHSSAQVVHAALLAIGAKVGHPVQWDPKFKPPTGTEIEIEVRWLNPTEKDPSKKNAAEKWQSCPAQQWILDLNTHKPMTHPWVFAGSRFWKDEESGRQIYQAESGDFICVSNFASATLDIPVQSSQANDGLLFEANTPKIPPIGTPVRLVLQPKLEKEK